MPVGGSRHYTGSGLGAESGWKCPACGAENAGPIAAGCQLCGSGKPGWRAADPPPPPPITIEPPVDAIDDAAAWARRHRDATLEQAYTAGYVEGFRQARRDLVEQARREQAAEQPLPTTVEAKELRTFIAALELFRDQVLIGDPEEVQKGEWLSAQEVASLIARLRHEEAVRV